MGKEFTESAFLSHLAACQAAMSEGITRALRDSAKELVKDARSTVGHYQEEVGPFPAWAPLTDSTIDDRIRQGFTPDEPGLRTGDMRDSYGAQVSRNKLTLGNTSEKALWFELGRMEQANYQPPRPVIGPVLFSNEAKITKRIARRIAAHLAGSRTLQSGEVDE